MLTRREWLGGSVVGAAVGGEQRATFSDDQAGRLVAALETIATETAAGTRGCSTGACPVTAKIRDLSTSFLRANQKFPDALDVGVGVFYEVYDWHVRNRQPLSVTRLPDGRYTLGFMFTRLILRIDAVADYIGVPYDMRP